MSAFEHIVTLLSFVYALAITHLLASIAMLFRASARVRFSWIHGFWMANALFIIMANWIGFWDLRTLPSWSVGTIFFTFLMAFVNYLQAALVSPHVPPEGRVDLVEFQDQQRLRIIGAFALSAAFAFVANFIYGDVYNLLQLRAQNLAVVPMVVIALAATASRARWVQVAAPLALATVWTFYFAYLQGALR